MSEQSKVEWTTATWVVVEGCDPISKGCLHCYAILEVWRMAHNPNPRVSLPLAGLVDKRDGSLRWTGRVELRHDRLEQPLTWRESSLVFVTSLGDLFHERVPDDFLDRVFATMARAHWHTFQVLTKRDDRLADYLSDPGTEARVKVLAEAHAPWPGWPLPNVWAGVSVEDRENLGRIDSLRRTPAALRFLSCEPLLEDLGEVDLTGIGWVILGGESKQGRRDPRPCDLSWLRSLLAQAKTQGVVPFVKQLGDHPILDAERLDFGKKGGGYADWPANLRVREMPKPPAP